MDAFVASCRHALPREGDAPAHFDKKCLRFWRYLQGLTHMPALQPAVSATQASPDRTVVVRQASSAHAARPTNPLQDPRLPSATPVPLAVQHITTLSSATAWPAASSRAANTSSLRGVPTAPSPASAVPLSAVSATLTLHHRTADVRPASSPGDACSAAPPHDSRSTPPDSQSATSVQHPTTQSASAAARSAVPTGAKFSPVASSQSPSMRTAVSSAAALAAAPPQRVGPLQPSHSASTVSPVARFPSGPEMQRRQSPSSSTPLVWPAVSSRAASTSSLRGVPTALPPASAALPSAVSATQTSPGQTKQTVDVRPASSPGDTCSAAPLQEPRLPPP